MNCRNYKYEIIDAFKLSKDLAYYCEKRKIFQKDFFYQLGISVSTISNSVNNITQGKAKRDGINLDDYEYCSKYGMMQVSYLKSICMEAGLNYEDYVVKKKQIKKLNAITAAELLSEDDKPEINIYDKIDKIIMQLENGNGIQENILNDMVTLSDMVKCISNLASKVNGITMLIESIGRIEVQNMEYLKEIKDGIEKLNEKWN